LNAPIAIDRARNTDQADQVITIDHITSVIPVQAGIQKRVCASYNLCGPQTRAAGFPLSRE
jgi:hypothetical protein